MNSPSPQIEVLMATWNGARFLEEQLDSVFSQTFQNFRLSIRDDGSTDSTLQILERFQSRCPGRVFIRRNGNRLGACRTFSLLAEESAAPYVAFCDQDDIWRSDKLELNLSAMRESEAQHGIDCPVLVFSNMKLVGEDRHVMSRSLWAQAHVNPGRASLGTMLVQNLVTGCTALANRSLVLRGCPIPEGAVMHDSWLGLVAAAFGVLHPIHEPVVEYRQHRDNAVGAGRGWRHGSIFQRLRRDQPFKDRIDASRRQAKTFIRTYAQLLTAEQKNTCEAWAKSQDLPALVRQWTLHRNGLRGTSFFNHVGFLMRV